MSRPDPRLDALGLVPHRVPTEALLSEAAREHAASEERMRRLCPDRAPGMAHPGFRDTRAPSPDADRGDALAAAFVLAALVASFACGAVVQALGGWPAALAVGSACAGAAVWTVRREVRHAG